MNVVHKDASFSKLEDKLKAVILKCQPKYLVDSKDTNSALGVDMHKIAQADRVEHYSLPEGLHVYKYFSGVDPINYFVTAQPLYTPVERTGSRESTYVNEYFSGISCIEYSRGGDGNSVPVGRDANYFGQPHISLLSTDVYSTDELSKEVIATSDQQLTFPAGSNFTPYYMGEISDMRKIAETGDLFEYIKNSSAKDAYIEKSLNNIQATTDIINSIYLSKMEKSSLLKALLGRNKELSSRIDVFKASKKGR